MSQFTGEQRAFAVQAFYENGHSYIIVRRMFRVKFNLRSIRQCPSTQLLKQWLKRFQETGSTLPMRRQGRSRTLRTEQAIQEVNRSVQKCGTHYAKTFGDFEDFAKQLKTNFETRFEASSL
ncbi:unnamed protein product [Parnassius apollo]|uniref:(apollo) hypothetical protein n=1 Tax=Parnassius apollo TaxID=110799 RepID=A0A8S3XZC7_PARAO|nr:unnamed protein product [Parnassius apollo]